MALKIKLALEKASQGERLDRYYAQEGDWFFEVHVPSGERPTGANVEFEFQDDEGHPTMTTDEINVMTDRERILVNIAAELAHEVEYYQRLAVVQAHEHQWPRSARTIRTEWGMIERPKYRKGDLVVCFTSTGLQQNPWLISFVEADGCKDDPRGLLLRAIGTDKLCDYSNESFIRITGIPARLLWEGDQYQFSLKLHKALNKIGNYMHVFRGLEFPDPNRAVIYVGERWGGMNKPTKPYTVEVQFTKRTSIKAIIAALEAGGFGTREFEPDDGTYNGPMQGLAVIRRADVVETLQAAGVDIK